MFVQHEFRGVPRMNTNEATRSRPLSGAAIHAGVSPTFPPMRLFAAFRLDLLNQCLWRRGDTGLEARILLAPKAFAVLVYLVEHAERLVTHDELLEAVWPDTVVEPQAVKRHVLAVRSALGDRPKNSLFIETMPKRGYRFIAPVSAPVAAKSPMGAIGPARDLVGRGSAFEVLCEMWQRALNGERQIVFITGEPGIGKTSLADEFQRQVAVGERSVHIAHGQCIEGYGSKEPYGPMLDALGRLCRGPQAEPLVRIMSAEAPTWLAQFPSLLTREHREMLHREILGATRERMLREIGDALESVTAETPLLLVFEDLHWVDDSTVDLISALARRRHPAKLMFLGTCRPLHTRSSPHPLEALMRDLVVRRFCREIALTSLNEAEVEEYLGAQSPTSRPPQGLSAFVHRHSEGNPLFMVAALEHMAKRGLLIRVDGLWQLRRPLEQIEFEVPDDMRRLIDAQLEQLSAAEQGELEQASIVGAVFSERLIGSAEDIQSHHLEDLYEDLSRRHHIVKWAGTHSFPDGSTTERYEFVHVLYRQVLYDRQLPARRARLHRQIGERLAALYAQRLEAVAPELAYHFEQAADWPRAIEFLQRAADLAVRRYAHRQADAMLTRALELVNHLPETERIGAEPQLLAALAALRRETFDMRAVETYETLVSRAADYGLVDTQVQALIDLSYMLAFTSADRCLGAAHRAQQLSDAQAPMMRSRIRTACAYRRILVSGWNAEDALEVREGLAGLDESSHLRWMCGEYREAVRLKHELREKEQLKRREESGPLILESKIGVGSGLQLVFLGEWGDALKEFAVAMADAQKNANDHTILWLQIQQAWLHVNAQDFTGALAMCQSAIARLSDGTPRTAPAVQLRRALIISGLALVALGDYARALEYFSTAANEMERQTVYLDWYWRMPLASGLTEAWLAKDDYVCARQEAGRFLEISLATAERTWQALAWEANARVAVAARNLERAQEYIERAISTVSGFEVPLAAWQVHATAATIEEELGNLEAARFQRDQSCATILRLANSLPQQEPLRKAFLSAPAVARILSRGA
jgi:DNA-binding winged helix-turn-helix (wHTH) protein/tetratricopeptide (TPR) repeat protein